MQGKGIWNLLLETHDGNIDVAFKNLVDEYSENIYWSIRRIVRNHEDTDDILQNTWIKVWSNLSKYRNEAEIYTWIYRIARNETLDYIRIAGRNSAVLIDESIVEKLVDNEQNVLLGPEEISAKLMAAVHALPEKQSIVFQLKYFEEMKYREMSELLKTSEGALKASYSISVQKIRKELELD